MPAQKIVTCCYCGTRAALVLRGRERHELSCASCGAPLHDMKMLRRDHVEDRVRVKPSPVRGTRPEKTKRRKSFGAFLLEEAWDMIEDIFD